MMKCADRSACFKAPFAHLSGCIERFIQTFLSERFCAGVKLPLNRRYDILEEICKAKCDSIMYKNGFVSHSNCSKKLYEFSDDDLPLCVHCKPLQAIVVNIQNRFSRSSARGLPTDASKDDILSRYSEVIFTLRNLRKKMRFREDKRSYI